jgi:hypothetical protein
MSRTPDELISAYLKQLDAELAGLPRASRRDVVEEISTHIAEMRASTGSAIRATSQPRPASVLECRRASEPGSR